MPIVSETAPGAGASTSTEISRSRREFLRPTTTSTHLPHPRTHAAHPDALAHSRKLRRASKSAGRANTANPADSRAAHDERSNALGTYVVSPAPYPRPVAYSAGYPRARTLSAFASSPPPIHPLRAGVRCVVLLPRLRTRTPSFRHGGTAEYRARAGPHDATPRPPILIYRIKIGAAACLRPFPTQARIRVAASVLLSPRVVARDSHRESRRIRSVGAHQSCRCADETFDANDEGDGDSIGSGDSNEDAEDSDAASMGSFISDHGSSDNEQDDVMYGEDGEEDEQSEAMSGEEAAAREIFGSDDESA
ncbi:hypothetical protein B0H17DRAFT_1216668 [Mycena rosella]|uniref:Uncharacterized protein n=1 Tax=Mycena rosella TaxID=1033263 RepID=A0AAD7C885_MYCRO|nr:hypothetical protein B0H17DRAFT_1216668 [Mycena rosella]